ncbi:uncharacterized protein C16orf46 [Stegostoma tigrinum]|uniref:uncharacterized protein C16orf46 n=1 Tax=Stegostoma tigrinum TaxID=3053191 RepID=UPI00202B3E0C|nr:uncharacterized protein C16orf46 [Stegostoma tigrinum]XP_048402744.1 uncharacterized protein C16orf46 [Stegostoma tigrinum]XP_048402745.1 uncharacterized protein C16orf46 [Stegostoma tigrinum]XP_048402746.1 uncharacterized protein C16orf46 [Stegostoma tigrinum]
MESQDEDMIECEKIPFPAAPHRDNKMARSPTHFIHSWESERKLIDVLIRLSEETYDDNQKQMDQIIVSNGWDDAMHGWRRDNSYTLLKKSKKSRKDGRKGNHCVFCAEMVPISEKKAFQNIDQSSLLSKSPSSTMVCKFTERNTKSSTERARPVSQTKLQLYSSTVSETQTKGTQELHVQDNKSEPEVNSSQEIECEIINAGPDQQTPATKHFSVLPPVKTANGDETYVSGFKTEKTFCLDLQNGNRDLQTASVVSKHNNKDSVGIRANACNMAMLQVSKIPKVGNSAPVGFTRIPFLSTMHHWCWQYSLMQGHQNLAINGVAASKIIECHSIKVQPSKITKHHTKNYKQANYSKSTYTHSTPINMRSNSIRHRNVTERDILPVIPQPGPPQLSGTTIPISILSHKFL